MDAKIGEFFQSVGNFFSGGDQIPWSDADIVAGCEREVAEAEKGSSDELKRECIMRLSWALVHSKRPEDVQRGIAMLQVPFITAADIFSIVEAVGSTCYFVRLYPSINLHSLIMVLQRIPAPSSSSASPLQTRERIYLLAVGYYRSGDYSRSRQLVEQCLEVASDWRQALCLKRAIEEKITKDGVIGIGIAATAVGLLVGGIAAAITRKK